MQCQIEGCARPIFVKIRGWCRLHYHRWHREGDPLWEPKSTEERFWEKVDAFGDCWEWNGALTGAGYGMLTYRIDGQKVNVGAHRYAWEILVGPIPTGYHIDHLCRNTVCVNPDHLEPVTPRENTLRGVGPSSANAEATHCVNGHPFTEENTWLDEKRNARHCRSCSRRRFREWNARAAARTGS